MSYTFALLGVISKTEVVQIPTNHGKNPDTNSVSHPLHDWTYGKSLKLISEKIKFLLHYTSLVPSPIPPFQCCTQKKGEDLVDLVM